MCVCFPRKNKHIIINSSIDVFDSLKKQDHKSHSFKNRNMLVAIFSIHQLIRVICPFESDLCGYTACFWFTEKNL